MSTFQSEFTGAQIDALLSMNKITDLKSGDDFNDIVTPGFYRIANGTIFGTLVNRPTGAVNAGSILIVIPFAWDGAVVQILICNQTTSMFIRNVTVSGLSGNDWTVTNRELVSYKRIGTTSQRPSFPSNQINWCIGSFFFDTTLGKPIWYTGDTSDGKTGWVDSTGQSV